MHFCVIFSPSVGTNFVCFGYLFDIWVPSTLGTRTEFKSFIRLVQEDTGGGQGGDPVGGKHPRGWTGALGNAGEQELGDPTQGVVRGVIYTQLLTVAG